MSLPTKDYYFIENQTLDTSLIKNYKEDYNPEYVLEEYKEFLTKCYIINNTIYPYELAKYTMFHTYFCLNGEIYLKYNSYYRNSKKKKIRKYNFITTDQQIIDDYEYSDDTFNFNILYFPNVPEEIGKLEIIFYEPSPRKTKWKQYLFGDKYAKIRYPIASGTAIIINHLTTYKFSVETKTKTEYKLPILEFKCYI